MSHLPKLRKIPKDEYSLGNIFKKEANTFAEYTGLYGFVAKSACKLKWSLLPG